MRSENSSNKQRNAGISESEDQIAAGCFFNPSKIPIPNILAQSGAEIASAYQGLAAQQLLFAASAQGKDAFGSTRALAAAHEAGHWVWLAAHGRGGEITSARIWRDENGEWTGLVAFDHNVVIDPNTPAGAIREFVGLTLAGFAGEWLSGRIQLGSSIDEQTLAHLACGALAAKTGADPKMLFIEIMFDTVDQLKANTVAFDAIRAELERHHWLRGKAVARLSALVRPYTATTGIGAMAVDAVRELMAFHPRDFTDRASERNKQ